MRNPQLQLVLPALTMKRCVVWIARTTTRMSGCFAGRLVFISSQTHATPNARSPLVCSHSTRIGKPSYCLDSQLGFWETKHVIFSPFFSVPSVNVSSHLEALFLQFFQVFRVESLIMHVLIHLSSLPEVFTIYIGWMAGKRVWKVPKCLPLCVGKLSKACHFLILSVV